MKKVLSVILLCCLLLGMLPTSAMAAGKSIKVGNVTVTDTFTKHSEAHCSKKMGSGRHVCCWYGAAAAYKKIWGTGFSRSATKTNLLRDVAAKERKMTAANLDKFFAQAKPGAMFRMSGDSSKMGTPDSTGHSMLFLQKASGGAYFYEVNYNGKGNSRVHLWTWNALVKSYGGRYPYIKYISWPNAPKLVTSLGKPSLKVSNATSGVTCSWAMVGNAAGYEIYRDGKKIGTTSKGSAVSFVDKTAKSGVSYKYHVVAVCGTVKSKASDTKSITYLAAPSLSSVSNPSSILLWQNHLKASWKKASSASGYEMQISSNENFSKPRTVKISGGSKTTYTVKDMKLGKYYVRIRAVKGSTYSAWSNVKTVNVKR